MYWFPFTRWFFMPLYDGVYPGELMYRLLALAVILGAAIVAYRWKNKRLGIGVCIILATLALSGEILYQIRSIGTQLAAIFFGAPALLLCLGILLGRGIWAIQQVRNRSQTRPDSV